MLARSHFRCQRANRRFADIASERPYGAKSIEGEDTPVEFLVPIGRL